MRLGLGIDAGGTYTDTVLYDFQRQQVLGKGKALTTKDDYAVGIAASLDQIEIHSPEKVDLVGLSTTLATNALVEGKGAKTGILLIGYDPELVKRFLRVSPYWIVSGGHDMRGRERVPLDEEEIRRAVEEMIEEVEVIAVSQMGGAVNPQHEQWVQAFIQEHYDVPVISGHEISTEMDSMKRATTVFWNARLIPILLDLMDAVEKVLISRGITAPIMLERSDGTLMGKELARRRPIETLMSGPVASVYGALHLTGCRNALIVDMGGTTTDIGLVQDGMPRLKSEGARIGQYRTTVRTLDLHTTGLGGDSQISLAEDGTLTIGPQRVIPVSYAAVLCPAIAEELASWKEIRDSHVDSDLLPPVEFFLSVQSPRVEEARRGTHQAVQVKQLGRWEQTAWQTLKSLGGASRIRLADAMGYPYPSLLRMDALESAGLVWKAGLTPTDVLHAMGELQLWDSRAARHAVEAFAYSWQVSPEAACQHIMEAVQQRLAEKVLDVILAETLAGRVGYNGQMIRPRGASWTRASEVPAIEDCAVCRHLVHASLMKGGGKGQPLECSVKINLPIVAVGAPVKAYFPALAAALQTQLYIPEHADVANALGAITGNIAVTAEAVISVTGDELYIIQGLAENNTFDDLEEATARAMAHVRALAEERALAAGAEAVQVEVSQKDVISEVGDEKAALFLERRLVARATGRPKTRA
ncbi:MAG TPA: hydantoinase/oxoprolinase family protein [Firmicutes bacterium]|nr:hydantoinase/oxoprolinase family protein [Bacillota bacterium]